MAYKVVPEPHEVVEAQIGLNLSKKARPFHFAVSNQALYIPRIKLIAKTDPYYFQRISLEKVQLVTINRLRPYALWLLAALMIPTGLITTINMMEPIFRNEPGQHEMSGWPISVFVCGFLVPFVAKRRFGLQVEFSDGRYRWKPPLVVDKASKQKIADTLTTIIRACEKVGVRISDSRAG